MQSDAIIRNPQMNNNLPSENYSFATKALILTGLAISALGTYASARLASSNIYGKISVKVIILSVILCSPLIVLGVGICLWANSKHTKEVADQFFNFAKSQNDDNIKLQYYSKSANLGHTSAILEEYSIGKNLMLNSKNEDDFDKGFNIVTESIIHRIDAEPFCLFDTRAMVTKYLAKNNYLKNWLKERVAVDNKGDAERAINWFNSRFYVTPDKSQFLINHNPNDHI